MVYEVACKNGRQEEVFEKLMRKGIQMSLTKLSEFPFVDNGLECYYHTSSVDNAVDILRHFHLFGSLPSKVNDPKDLCIQITGWERNDERIPPAIDKKSFEQGLNKALANKGVVDRTMRILCMAEVSKVDSDIESQKMFWSKYCNNGKGVRFKFLVNSNFLIQPLGDETFFEQVQYSGREKVIDAAKIRNDFDIAQMLLTGAFMRDLLFSKEGRWGVEHEYRFCATVTRLNLQMSDITSKEERFYVFNPKNLLGVMVGKSVDEEDECKLRVALQPLGLNLGKSSI